MACIPEEDLLELATGERSLAAAPALEAHLADCGACSGLLCTLMAGPRERRRDLAGTALGPYRLDGLVGAGAMGEVYRAWDERLQRAVAVKVLAAGLADSPDRVRRLEVEGRAAAAIAHPNVVTVYDTGNAGGVAFVVSELIDGESLRSLIDRGAIDRRRALDLGLQLARGVAAAHAQGVVHRDLKPTNLLVTDGTLKILDFGLAKVGGDRDVEATEPGTLLGTCGYLSPEQARGEPADARSDIFAIGAILYELLAGRRAFDGATFAERLSGVLRDMPPPLDDALWPIVQRCLDKDPRKRFQSAGDLAWVLQAQEPPPPVRAPRPRAMISRRTFLAGLAATGAGGVLAGRQLRVPPAPAGAPEYRQLTFRQGRLGRARFSPDGGSVLYSALWEELPPALYTTRPAGGGTRALDLPPAQLLAVSSRGQLALGLDHHYGEGFAQRGQLAVAPLEGGTPRALGVDVQEADFHPDGTQLAVVRQVGSRFRLELPLGRVLLEAGWISHARVSPDGALVACCVHDDYRDNRGDVAVVPSAGGAARTVAAGWSSLDGLAWTADGRALWVSASREGGNNSLRRIGLDGRERGHVSSAGRVRVNDVAPSGTLAITHVTGRMWMKGKPPGAPAELDLGLSDVTLVAAIAADGAAVACSEFGDVDTATGVYLRATDGSAAHRVGGGVAFDLGPAGVLGSRGAPSALAVYPIDRGTPRPYAVAGLGQIRAARWCADGVIVAASADGRPRRLWHVAGGPPRPLTDEGVDETFVVRPDGRAVALVAGDRLHVVELAGPRRVLAAADEAVCGWSSDGGAVFLRTLQTPVRVRALELATGASTPRFEVRPPRLGLRGVAALVVDARGEGYAYSFGQELSRLYSMALDGVTGG